MTLRRAGLAVLGVVAVAIAVVDPGWIPSYLLLVAVAIGAPWALVRLSRRGPASQGAAGAGRTADTRLQDEPPPTARGCSRP